MNADFIPKLGDGTCARTTLRGVPAAVGTDGVVLYTGAEAIGVLGPAELVRRAVAALRPVAPGAPSALPAPNTQPRAALADCRSVPGPFEPVTGRLRRLLKSSGLPLVTAGTWFQDAQLTNAEQVGRSVSLDYESCRLGSALAACASTLSITVEPVNRSVVMSDLRGAKCTRFSVGGAPGVVWNNQLPSGDAAGVYLFAGGATVATGRDFTLEHVDPGKIRRAARALRPLGAGALPKPSFDAGRLVGLCAKTS